MSITPFTECRDLLTPDRVWSRSEVLSASSPVPKSPGVYAWYFRNFPPEIPTTNCMRYNDFTLLYIGISPCAPPKNGEIRSKQNLFRRIRNHYQGNASGSTLRLSLGCLLSVSLSIELRRVGSGNRLTFADGEKRLSDWMDGNAFVTWIECDAPWRIEERADFNNLPTAEPRPEQEQRVSSCLIGAAATGEDPGARPADLELRGTTCDSCRVQIYRRWLTAQKVVVCTKSHADCDLPRFLRSTATWEISFAQNIVG